VILTVNIHPTAIKVARSGQGGRNVALEMTDATGSTIASIFLASVEDANRLLGVVSEAKHMLIGSDADHAIAGDVDAQLRQDGEALGRRIAADEGIEPKADPVPWPAGLCGHPVPPGAWAAGFTRCRDCITSEHDTFDRAARQLSVAPARPEDLDDADGGN
jgi:hypothetical protein